MTVTAMPQTAAPEKDAKDAKGTKGAKGEAKEKKSKKKLIIILVAVLVLGGAAYEMVLKPAPTGPPKPGTVVTLDPIQINLQGDHYLRIGIALQMVKGAAAPDGSKALDATIDIFSGLPMTEVNDATHRAELKKQLVKELSARYDKGVMGVYFTELVTQ